MWSNLLLYLSLYLFALLLLLHFLLPRLTMLNQSAFNDPEYRDLNSAANGTSYPRETDKTRQEMAPDTDINRMMRNLGVVQSRPFAVGVADFDVDLTRAHEMRQQLQDAVSSIPDDIASLNGGRRVIFAGLLDGSLTELKVPAQGSPDAVPGGPGDGTPPPQAER